MKRLIHVKTIHNLKEAALRELKVKPEVIYQSVVIDDSIKNIGQNKKFFVRTYGCQGNFRDGEVIEGILQQLRYQKTTNLEDADVIILKTCAIRVNAEKKVFGEIGLLKKLKLKNPDLLFGVCGCMVQQEHIVKKIMESYEQVDFIFGTHNIHRLPTLLKEAMFSKEMVVEVWAKEGDVIENYVWL